MRQRASLCLLVLTVSCYRVSPQWAHLLTERFNAHTFPCTVEAGVKKLRSGVVVEELPQSADAVRHFRLTSYDPAEKAACLVSGRDQSAGASSSFQLDSASDPWCSSQLWARLDDAGYARARDDIDAQARADYQQAGEAEHVKNEAQAERDLAVEAAWQPRWAPTGVLGVNAQTNGEFGLAVRAGIRRWSGLHLGWSVDLGYDLQTSNPLRHELAISGHFDVLWPDEGSPLLPLGSVSLFAAPVVGLAGGDVGLGWRAGVRGSVLVGDRFGDWPMFLSVTYEYAPPSSAHPAVIRAARFSWGLGF